MKKLLLLSIVFVGSIFFAQKVHATSYYVDFSAAAGGNGAASSTAWNNLDAFTEVARTAGDVVWVRRGQSTTTQMSNLNFTSDGQFNNPIYISADNDNIWGDNATSSQTYTTTFGSKTFTANTTISGITAGDWIYVIGDQSENTAAPSVYDKDYLYEVASTTQGSVTTLTLYMPYKGKQIGAGLSLKVLPDNPIWNTTSGSSEWNFSQDEFWFVKGMDIRGSAGASGNIISVFAERILTFQELIMNGDTSGNSGIAGNEGLYLVKSRFFNVKWPFGQNANNIYVKDSLFDCNNISSSSFIRALGDNWFNAIDTEILNCSATQSNLNAGLPVPVYFRNVKGYNNTFQLAGSTMGRYSIYKEDDFGITGLNSRNDWPRSADSLSGTTTTKSLAAVRSGGGASSLLVNPPAGATSTGISTKIFPFTYIKLFEYPIYTASNTPYTYTVYFQQASSSPTADWTADPTASEMWIEAEYYKDATDADRMLTKSTGVLDFNGTSGSWQSLSVTATSSQDGILYLRGWYGKPRESAKTNSFYVDVKPVISTP